MLIDNDLMVLSILNMNNNISNAETCSSAEGFIKGNIFTNEYKPYKNYKPFFPKTSNEKSALLYEIMELEFAVYDLNLWLDIHPDDKKIYTIQKEYMKKLANCESVFVNKYGPLEITDNIYEDNKWVNNWPWEKEDSVYV